MPCGAGRPGEPARGDPLKKASACWCEVGHDDRPGVGPAPMDDLAAPARPIGWRGSGFYDGPRSNALLAGFIGRHTGMFLQHMGPCAVSASCT
jgi:hypothetical protein